MIESQKEKTQEETKVVCVISFQHHFICKLKSITLPNVEKHQNSAMTKTNIKLFKNVRYSIWSRHQGFLCFLSRFFISFRIQILPNNISSIEAYLLLESNQLITLSYIFDHNFSQYQEFRRDRKLKTLDTNKGK